MWATVVVFFLNFLNLDMGYYCSYLFWLFKLRMSYPLINNSFYASNLKSSKKETGLKGDVMLEDYDRILDKMTNVSWFDKATLFSSFYTSEKRVFNYLIFFLYVFIICSTQIHAVL